MSERLYGDFWSDWEYVWSAALLCLGLPQARDQPSVVWLPSVNGTVETRRPESECKADLPTLHRRGADGAHPEAQTAGAKTMLPLCQAVRANQKREHGQFPESGQLRENSSFRWLSFSGAGHGPLALFHTWGPTGGQRAHKL